MVFVFLTLFFGLLGRRFWSEKLHKIHHCNRLQVFNSRTSVTFSVPTVHDFFSTNNSLPPIADLVTTLPLFLIPSVLKKFCSFLVWHLTNLSSLSLACTKLAFYGWTSQCTYGTYCLSPLLFCDCQLGTGRYRSLAFLLFWDVCPEVELLWWCFDQNALPKCICSISHRKGLRKRASYFVQVHFSTRLALRRHLGSRGTWLPSFNSPTLTSNLCLQICPLLATNNFLTMHASICVHGIGDHSGTCTYWVSTQTLS